MHTNSEKLNGRLERERIRRHYFPVVDSLLEENKVISSVANLSYARMLSDLTFHPS